MSAELCQVKQEFSMVAQQQLGAAKQLRGAQAQGGKASDSIGHPSSAGQQQQAGGKHKNSTPPVPKGCTSNKFVIAKLEQELHEKRTIYTELAEVNSELKAKERVLLENVTAQGDNLHFVALAAFQERNLVHDSHIDSAVSNMVASLMQDVKAHEMLSIIGSSSTPDEPYTTKCMRMAFTPERVEEVRNASLADVVAQLRSLTMQLAVMLHLPDCCNNLLANNLDTIVDQYTELAMLMHIVSDKANLELGVLNLDTMQEQEPPEGHWQRVLGFLELQPDQIRHLRTGFQVYQCKTVPLVEVSHELVRQMQRITFDDMPDSAPASASSFTAAAMEVQLVSPADSLTGATAAAAVSAAAGAAAAPGAGSFTGSTAAAAPAAATLSPPPPAVQAADTKQQRAAAVAAHQAAAAAAAMQTDEPPMGWMHSGDSSSGGTGFKPWQELGLPSGGLTAESADQLDGLMCKLLDTIMKLRELHRTLTFLWLNTLDRRQKAISIVQSYPFWSRPLTMLKHLVEEGGSNLSGGTSQNKCAQEQTTPDKCTQDKSGQH